MPRDTAHSGLPARRDFTAPAAPFVTAGDAANIVIDQLIEGFGTRSAAQVAFDADHTRLEAEAEDMVATAKAVADAAPVSSDMPDFQRRRARVWAMADHIRQALADTLQGEFTVDQINGAANVIIDFPTAWVSYAPWEGTPPALSAYECALRELADPARTVKRLQQLGRWRFDEVGKHLVDAGEQLGRFAAREGSEREYARARFDVAMAGASREFEAGAALMASAEGFRAKLAEAA
jgi:hypothetical protein